MKDRPDRLVLTKVLDRKHETFSLSIESIFAVKCKKKIPQQFHSSVTHTAIVVTRGYTKIKWYLNNLPICESMHRKYR